MRVLLKPSETTKIFDNWTVTLVIHRIVVSRSPFPFGISRRFECFMFAGHKAVIHLEMFAVSE